MSKPSIHARSGWLRLILPGLALLLIGAAGPGEPEPPLVEAARRALGAEILRPLLQQGADVNVAHGDGSTALHWVSFWDDLESADLLFSWPTPFAFSVGRIEIVPRLYPGLQY